ncbi:DUF1819 family protein [Advenella sp. WQ 585]|uniref:DUF1819 family protein n=1 Tax=Advenella mandrilli TaxID=2800330 RepID=A0ABS1EBD4_9BURK|nr:DUF1819 family protein [Advenella mandrilli]MBK1780891.1 DUF1819 family protein [Advenella mandrilli]
MNSITPLSKDYRMSFTAASLCISDSAILAGRYLDQGDWEQVRNGAFAENLLQVRTQSSLRRLLRELTTRLETLSPAELELLTKATEPHQAQVLWLAVCRCYPFVAEFAAEVVRERYLSLKYELPLGEFDAFFNRKVQWHPELDSISPSTHNKLRQVLFRLLREAGLLSAQRTIQGVQLNPQLAQLLRQGRPEEALYFPTFDTQIKT